MDCTAHDLDKLREITHLSVSRTKFGESDKNDSEKPVVICYCNKITDKEITKSVKETGLKTVDEVKRLLRENLTSNCAELNPTGKCCHTAFEEVIRTASGKPIFQAHT